MVMPLQVTDSSDSSDEGELSLDDRPEYREEQEVAQVLSLEERADDNSLEEQLGRVKLAEGALREGVGASFGEKGALPPHIDIGSLGSNSTIVIGTHITVLPAENTKPIQTSPTTTPGESTPALDHSSTTSVTTSTSSVSSTSNLQRQTEDIRFFFTSQLANPTLPWIVPPATHFENFTVSNKSKFEPLWPSL